MQLEFGPYMHVHKMLVEKRRGSRRACTCARKGMRWTEKLTDTNFLLLAEAGRRNGHYVWKW